MKKSKISGLFLLYVLLVTFLVISNDVVEYQFKVLEFPIYMSVFTYPVLYLIANAITKEYGEKETIRAILLALSIQIIIFLVNGFISQSIDLNLILAAALSFSISQAVNLFICSSMKEKKGSLGFKLFLQYAFVILIDNLIFLLWMKDFSNMALLSGTFLISYAIKLMISLVLVSLELYYIRKPQK